MIDLNCLDNFFVKKYSPFLNKNIITIILDKFPVKFLIENYEYFRVRIKNDDILNLINDYVKIFKSKEILKQKLLKYYI